VSNIQTIDKIKIKNLFWQEYSNKTDPLITKYILKQYKNFFFKYKMTRFIHLIKSYQK